MLESLSALCSVLQIVGLVLSIAWRRLPAFVGVIIGISGFAAVVKVFLPISTGAGPMTYFAGLVGLATVAISCDFVQRRVQM